MKAASSVRVLSQLYGSCFKHSYFWIQVVQLKRLGTSKIAQEFTKPCKQHRVCRSLQAMRHTIPNGACSPSYPSLATVRKVMFAQSVQNPQKRSTHKSGDIARFYLACVSGSSVTFSPYSKNKKAQKVAKAKKDRTAPVCHFHIGGQNFRNRHMLPATYRFNLCCNASSIPCVLSRQSQYIRMFSDEHENSASKFWRFGSSGATSQMFRWTYIARSRYILTNSDDLFFFVSTVQ